MRGWVHRWHILVAALAVLAAACGGAASTAGSDSTSTAQEPSESSSTDASTGEGDTFAEIFGYAEDDPEAAEAQMRAQEAELQELIRQCMAEEGFEYIPVEPPSDAFRFDSGDQEEFVRTQGFGISTWYGNEEQFTEEADAYEDPNQPIVDAMSESEQEAYFGALYGTAEEQAALEETVIDEDTGEEYITVEGYGPGCQGEASAEVYGDMSQDEELYSQLEPVYQELEQRLQADPKVVEANEQWSSCMADQGYEYESPQSFYESVYQDFQERFDAIVGPDGGYSDPLAGMSQEEIDAFFAERSEDEINAFFEEAQREAEASVDQEALDALQQEEIDLAVAEYECSQPLQDIYTAASEDIERALVAENRELFEQLRESQGN